MPCTQIEVLVHGKGCPDKRTQYLYHYHGWDDVGETDNIEHVITWVRDDLARMVAERRKEMEDT